MKLQSELARLILSARDAQRNATRDNELGDALEDFKRESGLEVWRAELTDTYGGEANYSWVRRAVFCAPKDATQAHVMALAKASVDILGSRGETQRDGADSYEFRPYGQCMVLFVTWEG